MQFFVISFNPTFVFVNFKYSTKGNNIKNSNNGITSSSSHIT